MSINNFLCVNAQMYKFELQKTIQDWRLPSLSEFKIIFDALHKIDKIKFDESTSYWSNEEVEGKENWAWSFYFDYGKPFDDTKEYESMVRLVRNIEC